MISSAAAITIRLVKELARISFQRRWIALMTARRSIGGASLVSSKIEAGVFIQFRGLDDSKPACSLHTLKRVGTASNSTSQSRTQAFPDNPVSNADLFTSLASFGGIECQINQVMNIIIYQYVH
jgi:hypothetical protein